MNLTELQEEDNIKEWLINVKATNNTEKSFLQAMKQYTEFTGMTPEELLTQAEDEMGLPIRRRKLKKHILDFREHLQKQGVYETTVKTRIAAVKSFYGSFEIIPPKIRGESKPTTKKENDQIPTKEDIQDCLSIADPLEKAIMLAGISSGLSSNEIRNLKLSEFKKGYDPETEITTLELRRGKTGVDFITFFSPEASRAIWEYLAYRDRPLKSRGLIKNGQAEKQRTNDDSYLFTLKSVPKEYLETHDEELRKLSENAMLKLYRGISEKARKSTQKGCYNYIRSHTMRKYFNSALLNAGCDSFHTEFFMGHQLSDTEAAYFRANPKALKEIYQEYVPYLMIQKELNISESPEFIRLKNENEILARETAKAIVEREEIRRMNTEMHKLMMTTETMKFTIQIEQNQSVIREIEEIIGQGWKYDRLTGERVEVTPSEYETYLSNLHRLKQENNQKQRLVTEVENKYQKKIDELKNSFSEK